MKHQNYWLNRKYSWALKISDFPFKLFSFRLLIAPNEKFYFKDSLRDCQASICIIRIGKLPSIVIVTTGKDMGKVTITAGQPVKQQELYITDGEAGG